MSDSLPATALHAPHVVVIGGGITGLSAAWTLHQPGLARNPAVRHLQPRITVLEASDELGGKIRTSEIGGLSVDTGPDAFLARIPAGTQLCRELGLELTSPAETQAWLWSRKKLRPFPERTVLGVPSSLVALGRSGAVSPLGVMRAAADVVLPSSPEIDNFETSIADIVDRRMGREIRQRLVDPLLGGINASSIDELGFAAAPQLLDLTQNGRSLLLSARGHLRRQALSPRTGPVFAAPYGGMRTLVETLDKQLRNSGVDLRTSASVVGLSQIPGEGRWYVHLANGESINADAVLVTTPAPIAAHLLRDLVPDAAYLLASVEYSSVVMLRMVYDARAVPPLAPGSGFVVPATEKRLLTACSWASTKWAHLQDEDRFVLRASAGRLHDDRAMQLSDEELVQAIHQELVETMGVRWEPSFADVTRWPSSFPQYEPGHTERVLRIEQLLSVLPTLAVAGAAYHGLGISSCIKDGKEAAENLLTNLKNSSR